MPGLPRQFDQPAACCRRPAKEQLQSHATPSSLNQQLKRAAAVACNTPQPQATFTGNDRGCCNASLGGLVTAKRRDVPVQHAHLPRHTTTRKAPTPKLHTPCCKGVGDLKPRAANNGFALPRPVQQQAPQWRTTPCEGTTCTKCTTCRNSDASTIARAQSRNSRRHPTAHCRRLMAPACEPTDANHHQSKLLTHKPGAAGTNESPRSPNPCSANPATCYALPSDNSSSTLPRGCSHNPARSKRTAGVTTNAAVEIEQ